MLDGADQLAIDIGCGEPVRAARPAIWNVAAIAILYFLGGQIDYVLAPVSPAALWPPNAVLLGALLLTERRYWWIYLLAVLPADFAISHQIAIRYGFDLFASNVLPPALV